MTQSHSLSNLSQKYKPHSEISFENCSNTLEPVTWDRFGGFRAGEPFLEEDTEPSPSLPFVGVDYPQLGMWTEKSF